MARQAFVVSYYARGERRASDCDGDFYPTRSAAHERGAEMVADVASGRWDGSRTIEWIHRYTVRRVMLPEGGE